VTQIRGEMARRISGDRLDSGGGFGAIDAVEKFPQRRG